MPKVGDNITVTISGGKLSGPQGGASINIGSGASMTVSGKIIADHGSAWLVKLNMSIGGADTIEVPKY